MRKSVKSWRNMSVFHTIALFHPVAEKLGMFGEYAGAHHENLNGTGLSPSFEKG